MKTKTTPLKKANKCPDFVYNRSILGSSLAANQRLAKNGILLFFLFLIRKARPKVKEHRIKTTMWIRRGVG